jgi:glycosyltransferase involved in cell wall biosynthesis
LNVSFVNNASTEGGAAIAMNRLRQGVRRLGCNSSLLTKSGGTDTIETFVPLTLLETVFAKAAARLDLEIVDRWLREAPGWWSLNLIPNLTARRIKKNNPDLIHLHWVGDGFLPLWNIGGFAAPTIWTLHDAWAFTGGCHYFQDCENYVGGCGRCPQIGSRRTSDISRLVCRIKENKISRHAPVIVAPSRWLAECAGKSSVLHNCRIEIIPNGIDTEVFRPIDKLTARQLLRLPIDKKILLCGAVLGKNNPLKGYDIFEKSLHHLAGMMKQDEIAVVNFGDPQSGISADRISGFQAIHCGVLKDELSLSLLYSAADLFVLPSLQDNLPNTVMESLACGTPVVCFRSGGVVDMVEHNHNGFIADNFGPAELAQGIATVLGTEKHCQIMSANARATACKRFDITIVAAQYIELYHDVMQGIIRKR